jgi:phosphotransferase system enzyme I (PtsI)
MPCACARTVALDGNGGHVIIDPDAATRADFAGRVEAAAKERAGLTVFKTVTPKLADGRIIEVAANIGSLEEIEAAKEVGAMGVGLFRTELLFMRHMHLPSEDMQAETYAALAKAFAPYPVIVRTLDIGGDKPIAGIEFPDEENPSSAGAASACASTGPTSSSASCGRCCGPPCMATSR